VDLTPILPLFIGSVELSIAFVHQICGPQYCLCPSDMWTSILPFSIRYVAPQYCLCPSGLLYLNIALSIRYVEFIAVGLRLAKPNDMTIHWKALQDYLMT
jgi:hypothetical protein